MCIARLCAMVLSGYGDGMVARRAAEMQSTGADTAAGWVAPTNYHTDDLRARPVGNLYNTVANGIRTMPAYGKQVSILDRWAIVAYVKALQRSQNAKGADVPETQREHFFKVGCVSDSRRRSRLPQFMISDRRRMSLTGLLPSTFQKQNTMQTITPRDLGNEQRRARHSSHAIDRRGRAPWARGTSAAPACWASAGTESPRLFFHAYLVAFTFYLSITLGALCFVMLQHLTRAGWSISVRRLAEAVSGNIGLIGLLFIPIIFGMTDIYEWSHPEVAASLGAKAAYLNPSAFILRFVIYFAVWSLSAWFLRSPIDPAGYIGRSATEPLHGKGLRGRHGRTGRDNHPGIHRPVDEPQSPLGVDHFWRLFLYRQPACRHGCPDALRPGTSREWPASRARLPESITTTWASSPSPSYSSGAISRSASTC